MLAPSRSTTVWRSGARLDVRGVSRFTGLDPTLFDRRTLTVVDMQLGNYLLRREGKFIGQYDTRMIGPLDTTDAPYDPTKDPSLQNLLDEVDGAALPPRRARSNSRSDLLRYQGPFGGGYPPPTAFRGDWDFREMEARAWRLCGGRTSPGSRHAAQPRAARALGLRHLRPRVRLYGNIWSATHFEEPVARNVIAYSYPGGHAMYTDPRAHLQLAGERRRIHRRAAAPPPRPN